MTDLEKAAMAVLGVIDGFVPEDVHDFDIKIARAVLEAVRVPSDTMIKAGQSHAGLTKLTCKWQFQAMIDAALSEHKE